VRSSIFCVALLAVGCGGAQYFDATERATASSPRGDIAAEYEIAGPSGPSAEVKVWASGAYKDVVDGREMTVLDVVFDLENNGAEPIELSRIVLDSARASGVSFDDLPPIRVEGERIVRGHNEGRLHAYFALPERYDPEDIARFEVGWALRHQEGTYAQNTPFQQAPEYYYYSAYPFPSPYLYYLPFAGDPRPLPGTMP
jgi:hypothetical protein